MGRRTPGRCGGAVGRLRGTVAMAVEDILKKIKADAEEAASRIVAEGEKDAGAVAAEARARIESQRERVRAKARQRADEERNRIVTLARLSGRRELLSEKQRLIDRVFEETRQSIVEMDRDEYRRLIGTLLRDTREPGDAEVERWVMAASRPRCAAALRGRSSEPATGTPGRGRPAPS